jgi:hypothetical protein
VRLHRYGSVSDDIRREASPTDWAALEAEAVVTPRDVAEDRRFWGRWGTRLFRAMLGAKEEK